MNIKFLQTFIAPGNAAPSLKINRAALAENLPNPARADKWIVLMHVPVVSGAEGNEIIQSVVSSQGYRNLVVDVKESAVGATISLRIQVAALASIAPVYGVDRRCG